MRTAPTVLSLGHRPPPATQARGNPDQPRYLMTERGIGYRLSSGAAAPARADRAAHRTLAARLHRPSARGPAADPVAGRRPDPDRVRLRRRGRRPSWRSSWSSAPSLGPRSWPSSTPRPRRRLPLLPLAGGARETRDATGRRRRLPPAGQFARRAEPPGRHPGPRGQQVPIDEEPRRSSARSSSAVRIGHARPDVALRGAGVRRRRPPAAGRLSRHGEGPRRSDRRARALGIGHRAGAPARHSRVHGERSPSSTSRSAIGCARSSTRRGRAAWSRRRRRSTC